MKFANRNDHSPTSYLSNLIFYLMFSAHVSHSFNPIMNSLHDFSISYFFNVLSFFVISYRLSFGVGGFLYLFFHPPFIPSKHTHTQTHTHIYILSSSHNAFDLYVSNMTVSCSLYFSINFIYNARRIDGSEGFSFISSLYIL